MTLLEKIYDLSPEQSRVLDSRFVDAQLVEVREYENYRWLQIGGNSIQGLMDINAVDEILLPNIQALLASLLFCHKPNRLLNLGFGCGSIERFLAEKLPELEVLSLESNQAVIQLAKKFFFMPDDVSVVNSMADEFLAKEETAFDIILCDIFNDEEHPACLYDEHFYNDLAKRLDRKGVLAINLLPDSEDDVVEILLPMKNHFDFISLFEVPNHFNAIIYATNQRLADSEELALVANDLFKQTNLNLKDIPQGLNRLMERLEA